MVQSYLFNQRNNSVVIEGIELTQKDSTAFIDITSQDAYNFSDDASGNTMRSVLPEIIEGTITVWDCSPEAIKLSQIIWEFIDKDRRLATTPAIPGNAAPTLTFIFKDLASGQKITANLIPKAKPNINRAGERPMFAATFRFINVKYFQGE